MIIIKFAKGIKPLSSIALKPPKIPVWQLLDRFTTWHQKSSRRIGLGNMTLEVSTSEDLPMKRLNFYGEPQRLATTLSMSKCHVCNLQFVMSEQGWTLKPMHCQSRDFQGQDVAVSCCYTEWVHFSNPCNTGASNLGQTQRQSSNFCVDWLNFKS